LLAQSFYSIWVGGDAWEFIGGPNRYLVQAMPLLLLLAGAALARLNWRVLVPALSIALLWGQLTRIDPTIDECFCAPCPCCWTKKCWRTKG